MTLLYRQTIAVRRAPYVEICKGKCVSCLCNVYLIVSYIFLTVALCALKSISVSHISGKPSGYVLENENPSNCYERIIYTVCASPYLSQTYQISVEELGYTYRVSKSKVK
jgi:hypothetical protein